MEIAVGAGVRLAGRAGPHAPNAAAEPAAPVMMTATRVSTLAVGDAALVRGAAGSRRSCRAARHADLYALGTDRVLVA